jgi:hypothetical protein
MRLSRKGGLTLLVCLAAAACDGGGRAPDAQTQAFATSSELSVRFEVGADKPATVSVLGFRAAALGFDDRDVLGLVDPLGAAAPDQGCIVRDADLETRALVARGGSIDLEELSGVGVGLGRAVETTIVRPFPRVYPDVAGVVTGVVSEAGPQRITVVPEYISLFGADSDLPIAELAVPALPRLLTINGAAPVPAARVDVSGGLTLTLSNAAGALVELRPFGATVAVSCSVPANASAEALIAVPPALLAHLDRGGGSAVSLEVVRRLRPREQLLARGTRVLVEVRSTLPVELRP